jgi:hypothetical protein
MKRVRTGFWLALLLGVPFAAHALPLTDYRAREGDTLDLYVAGSSAQDNSLQRLFRFMCESGTLDVYRANGGDLRLYFITCLDPSAMFSSFSAAAPATPGETYVYLYGVGLKTG